MHMIGYFVRHFKQGRAAGAELHTIELGCN